MDEQQRKIWIIVPVLLQHTKAIHDSLRSEASCLQMYYYHCNIVMLTFVTIWGLHL